MLIKDNVFYISKYILNDGKMKKIHTKRGQNIKSVWKHKYKLSLRNLETVGHVVYQEASVDAIL